MRNRSIRSQILLPFSFVLLAAIMSMTGLTAFLSARQVSRNVERQLQDIVGVLVESDFPLTDTVLRQMKGLSGADFILTQVDGTVLASSGLDAEIPRTEVQPTAEWQQIVLGPSTTIDSKRYFHMAVRVKPRAAATVPAILHMLYPEAVLQEARRYAMVPAVIVGTTAFAILILVAMTIANRVSRPIVELRSQVEHLVRGQYTPVPVPSRHDEIRDLVLAVNLMAQQLTEMQQGIQRSERLALLGRLSGGLAHHLRNTITGARVAAQLHQRECTSDAESMEVVLRQLKFTEEHLRRFLAVGQPQQPRPRTIDLFDVIKDTAALIEPALRHKQVRFEYPTQGTPLWTDADPDHIRQLLLNLTLNAAEAAGPGGYVSIRATESQSVITLRILDSGEGVPDQLADRLFEPFVTSKPDGVGLGLAVAKQVAEAHHGQLSYIRSGHETCFELTLPVSSSKHANIEPPTTNAAAASLKVEL